MRNWILLGLCLLPPMAMAKDTIWLDNGDRIVGEILFKNNDRLVIATDYAGRITVDWEHVATLETDKPIAIVIKGVEDEAVSKLDVFENGTVICKQCKTPVVALEHIRTLVYPTVISDSFRSEGHIDLSANFERKDKDIDEYSLDSELRLYHGKWRHVVNGEVEKKSEDDETSKNKWNARYNIDRFFGEHLYFRTAVEYQKDYVEAVYRARSYGAGPGYLFWDDKLKRLDISLAYGNAHYWAEGPFELSFDATQLTWDFQHALFGDRVTFYARGDITEAYVKAIDLVIDAEMGFRYRISGWLLAHVSYEVDDIRTRYGDNREYQTTLGLGASW